ncbi:MAG: hypothetical protein LUD29_01600 [Clostridia bacterium]|nr:hypothetical protein [Clostridia bacterium]
MAISKNGREFSDKSNFINAVTNFYYVDKSLFIRDLIDDIGKADAMLLRVREGSENL